MIDPLYVKRNDRKYWKFLAKDADGIINLTGATIVLTAQNKATGINKIVKQACVITTAASGEYEYRPTAGDVDTADIDLSVETEITPQSGPKFTLPEKPEDEFVVIMVEDLDAT